MGKKILKSYVELNEEIETHFPTLTSKESKKK